jgi:hypothetical protein
MILKFKNSDTPDSGDTAAPAKARAAAPAAAPPIVEPPVSAPPKPEVKRPVASAAPVNPLAEKIRHFWRMTAMTEKEFGDLADRACRELDGTITAFDPYNGVTEELVRQLLADYARAVAERDEYCGRIVENNLNNFKAHGDKALTDFVKNIYYVPPDRELHLSLLLNFVRSVLRDDFVVQQQQNVVVDFEPGFVNRLWHEAAAHYFPEERE